MDRMSFVPGPEAREQIESSGHIVVDREMVMEFDDRFSECLFRIPVKEDSGSLRIGLIHATLLAALSVGDRIDIKFGGRDPATPEEEDPNGELIGYTWATFVAADGTEKVLWDFGRSTEPIPDAYATYAFNLYRWSLAEFQKIPPPAPLPMPEIPAKTPISRAMSPSNLFFASGGMWYFLAIINGPPSDESWNWISRPMRSYEALILSALLTLVYDAPPLVFAIMQRPEEASAMPESFQRTTYAFAPDAVVPPEAGKILIIM